MTNATVTAGAVAGLDLSAYLVTDPARSIAFYRDVLGLAPHDIDPKGQGAEFRLADGQTFGVWSTGDGRTGPVYMFGVRDSDAAIGRIRAAGGEITDGEVLPSCTMAFANDPSGNEFVIHQRHAGEPGSVVAATRLEDPAAIWGLDLSGYATKDAPAMVTFYRDVLGLEPESNDEGSGADYLLADGSYFGFWNGGEGFDYSGGVMFAVGDAKAAVARIRERGGVIGDSFESPVCVMALGKDPDGNDYIIHQRK